MTADEHYRKLEAMYLSAPCNAYFEPSMRIEEGRATVSIRVVPKLFHAAHAVHGSVYFKLLDDAAFFAVNSLVTDVFVLTTQFNVYLSRPVSTGEMKAEGRVTHAAHRLFVAESILADGDGRELGRGSGTFVPSKIPLGPEVGYGAC